jgi:hypothetical protein
VRKELVRDIHHLAAAFQGNVFTGIMPTEDGLTFYVQDDMRGRLVGVADFECKHKIMSACMVNTEGLKAALDQVKGDVIEIDQDGDNLRIGKAILAKRDVQELQAIDGMDGKGMRKLPSAITDLIATQFGTFITMTPASKFGWSLSIKDGEAWFGSTNGVLAKFGVAEIDADDFELRIPHEAAMIIGKFVHNVEAIYVGKKTLRLDRGNVRYFTPYEIEPAPITLEDVFDLVSGKDKTVEQSRTKVNLSDNLSALLKFSDEDSQVIVNIDKGIATAQVASAKIGSMSVELCEFMNAKLKTDFRLRIAQIGHLMLTEPALVKLVYRSGEPYCLAVTETDKPKKDDLYKRRLCTHVVSVSR